MAIYGSRCFSPYLSICESTIFHQFWFLIQNIGSRYARNPIKGSEDSDDSLVFNKNKSEKIGPLDWRLRPGKVDPLTCDALPREP